ncbi:hypothetical protein QL285_008246 [Trifolium repens]|nr:hypothetical protein QL285_008246 [Trifolium repens]
MITGRLRPVIKLVLGFGFDFGNENQMTCTRSNQHAFGNVLLAYENGLLLCLEKMCNSLSEWLLARASVTGPDNTPGRAPERVRPVLSAFTRHQLARASSGISILLVREQCIDCCAACFRKRVVLFERVLLTEACREHGFKSSKGKCILESLVQSRLEHN